MFHLLRNHSENVVHKNIKLLRDENQFFDVTLMCEDGVVASAHKSILASHSDKFKQILSQMSVSSSTGSQLCVYLTGLSGADLESVLDFMYVGEAKISQDRLVRFLNVAQQLRVTGLMDGSSSSPSSFSEQTILPDPIPPSSLVSTASQQIPTRTALESPAKADPPSSGRGLLEGSSFSFSSSNLRTISDTTSLSTSIQQSSIRKSHDSPSKSVFPSPSKVSSGSSSQPSSSSLKSKIVEPELIIKNENDLEFIIEEHNDFNDDEVSGETATFDNTDTPEEPPIENYQEPHDDEFVEEYDQDDASDKGLDVYMNIVKSNNAGNHSHQVKSRKRRKAHGKKAQIPQSSCPSPQKREKLIAWQSRSDEESSLVLLENLKCLGLSKLSKLEINNTKARKIVRNIMSRPTPKLPCPVPFMSEDQILPWMKEEILKDIIEQGKRPVSRIKWGEDSCHPSFWPDQIWPWHLVTNPSHSQKHKPEGVNVVETYKVAINNRLKQKNIDPGTFISEDYTEEEDIRKKRIRGLLNKTS